MFLLSLLTTAQSLFHNSTLERRVHATKMKLTEKLSMDAIYLLRSAMSWHYHSLKMGLKSFDITNLWTSTGEEGNSHHTTVNENTGRIDSQLKTGLILGLKFANQRMSAFTCVEKSCNGNQHIYHVIIVLFLTGNLI